MAADDIEPAFDPAYLNTYDLLKGYADAVGLRLSERRRLTPSLLLRSLHHNATLLRGALVPLLALVVAAAVYVVFYYNRLVRARNMLQEGWSGIDVQLRRAPTSSPT